MTTCRLCGSPEHTPFLDLGFTPPADSFLRPDQLDEPEKHYPLKVLRCNSCMFVYLSHVVAPEVLYRNEYPYESSMTSAGRSHFDTFAGSVVDSFGIAPGSLAVDIGSNVGVLLGGFKRRGCRALGIDPAENIAQIAIKNGIPTVPEFFSPEIADKCAAEYGRAEVITATNVFAHVDDLNTFMRAIDILLADNGIFIVEAPYLMHLLAELEYDTIYHEHLSYLSITPLIPFFKGCGFELFDVGQVDIHGGSNRLFIAREGVHKIRDIVPALEREEKKRRIHELDYLYDFSARVRNNREDLMTLIGDLRQQGKRLAGVSAPAKGMTLLNYCGINGRHLEFITEKSKLKIGRYAPGNHLPVLPDSALHEQDIDYALLLAWNFKDEIMANLREYRVKGGKFIIPIPEPRIV